jgi:hypothetical protein
MINFIKIPKALYFIGIFLIGSSLINGKYIEIVTTSFLVLIIIFALFYKENEPPVIVAALGFQWLSIVVGYIYLIFSDASQIDLLWRPVYSLPKIDDAYWLSIVGLLAFSIGLKIATFRTNLNLSGNALIEKYDTLKIIIIYIAFSLIFEPLASALRFVVPGLFQALNVLTYFKWTLFFLMVYISFKKNEYKTMVFAIIGVQTLLGFTGFFSEFKDFLILLPLVYLSFNQIKGSKQIITIILAVAILINIGAIWSYVKVEYRTYLSGGERSQAVTVSKQDALKKLWELSTSINSETYSLGFEALVKRIYFIEYFSATINNIPYFRPYMGGENWSKSIQHIFMPRLFFPNKEAIDDSKQTYLLTGIEVATADKGTSISTGYMAESYADYGPYMMHLAILVLGFVLGLIYKILLNKSLNGLWGFALIFPMFFLLNINGRALIKIFGDTAYFFIIFYFIKRFAVAYIDKFMLVQNKEES